MYRDTLANHLPPPCDIPWHWHVPLRVSLIIYLYDPFLQNYETLFYIPNFYQTFIIFRWITLTISSNSKFIKIDVSDIKKNFFSLQIMLKLRM